MTLSLLARMLMLVATLAIGSVIDARASDSVHPFPHIRTVDPHIRALIDDAMETSATVRALVERITASDVVVYVACERDPRVRLSGRLNFVSTAGGLRYVLVRLKRRGSRTAAIATLAHELQHAVEIADTPTIMDDVSLAREYQRMGYRSHSPHGLAFDTTAAVETGRRVVEELGARSPATIVAAR